MRLQLRTNGLLDVYVATNDIGTGTYTVLIQIAAEQFGIPMESVTVHLGDSSLPKTFVGGGSVTAASCGIAIKVTANTVKQALFKQSGDNRFKGIDPIETEFCDGYVALKHTPHDWVTLAQLFDLAGIDATDETGGSGPILMQMRKYVS